MGPQTRAELRIDDNRHGLGRPCYLATCRCASGRSVFGKKVPRFGQFGRIRFSRSAESYNVRDSTGRCAEDFVFGD